jgi:hypothetical protein
MYSPQSRCEHRAITDMGMKNLCVPGASVVPVTELRGTNQEAVSPCCHNDYKADSSTTHSCQYIHDFDQND